MPILYITIGLPGSGKTTAARKLQQTWTGPGLLARIGRDPIRREMLPHRPHGDSILETTVTTIQHAAIRAALTGGVSVVVDDTNLNPTHRAALRRIGVDCHATVKYVDLRGVDLEVCVAQDQLRLPAHQIGEVAITRMHDRWIRSSHRWARGDEVIARIVEDLDLPY